MKSIRPDGFYHREAGKYVKDAVYGANDGIITTFAIVAGVAGADLSATTIMLLGIANLFADGFSMAVSSWLSATSEKDVYHRERSVEEWELHHQRADERAEMQRMLASRGYTEADAKNLTELLIKNKDFWLDIMMREELSLFAFSSRPFRNALITFCAFVGAGIVPLLLYFVFPPDYPSLFWLAAALTGAALFLIGSLRSLFTSRRWFFAGLEMLMVGGIAAIIAYTIGAFAKTLIG